MKVEKWNFKGEEVDVTIFEEEDKETNEIIDKDLENTIDISKILNDEEDKNE